MNYKVNPTFILGVVCLVVFMSGGLISCLFASQGQLMFPFIWFILAPAPFGIFFTLLAYALLQSVCVFVAPGQKEESNITRIETAQNLAR
jgi:hypothetical protein